MNLKLITTENFNSLDCNFYRNNNDEIFLTREQIGEALEYSNPQKAIAKIHDKYKERLNLMSVRIKDSIPQSGVGDIQERVYYTTKGVMEICRWSRQPKADLFMDFVWEVMDKLMKNEPINNNDAMSNLILQTQATMQSVLQSQNAMTLLLVTITSALPQPYKPTFSRWMDKTLKKVDILADSNDCTRKQMLRSLYNDFEDIHDICLNEYQSEYCFLHNLQNTGIYTLNTIGADKDLKQWFDLMLQTLLDQIPTAAIASAAELLA